MKKVFINNNTGVIVIAHEKNSMEYDSNTDYWLLFEGGKKDCLKFIDTYWENNYVADEQRILIKD